MATKNATTFFIADAARYEKEQPYQIDNFTGPGVVVSNVEKEEHELRLTDLRTTDFRPNMNENLFEFIERPCELTKHVLKDDEAEIYAEETVPILKEMFNTEHVICFNLRVREAPSDGVITPSAPVHDAHFDYSTRDGWFRTLGSLTKEERIKFTSGKWRLRAVNLWRPLQDEVDDDSLAFCDPNTVDPKDVMPGNRVGPGYSVEIAHLRFNPNQEWYWMSKMNPDQIAVFQTFDSHPPKGKPSVPGVGHAAFKNWNAPPGTPARKSVETRYIIFTPAPYEAPILTSRPKTTKEQPWKKWIQANDPVDACRETQDHVRLVGFKDK